MDILFRVNQRASLLAGIDAPSSTMRISIDPATLTYAQRVVLSECLTDKLEAFNHVLGESPEPFGITLFEPTFEGVHYELNRLVHLREILAGRDEGSDAFGVRAAP